MKKKQLYSLIDSLDGFISEMNTTIIDPIKKFDTTKIANELDIRTVKKYQGKNQRSGKSARKLTKDMLVSSFMKKGDIEGISLAEFHMIDFATCVAMELADMSKMAPDDDDIRALLEITGYSAEDILTKTRFFEREFYKMPYGTVFVSILARAIYDAYAANKREKLKGIIDYLLKNELIFSFDEDDVFSEFYEKHAVLHFKENLADRAESIVTDMLEEKRAELDRMADSLGRADMQEMMSDPEFLIKHSDDAILHSNGSKGFLIERSEESVRKTDRIFDARNSLYELGEKAYLIIDGMREAQEKAKAEYIREYASSAVCEGAVREILESSDDTWECSLFIDISNDLCSLMPLPYHTTDFVLPEDYDEWSDDFIEFNGSLGIKIWDYNDTVKGEIENWGDSGMESRTIPVLLPSLIADYAEHRVPDSLYIRKSVIKIFREAGLSERRARDIAVIVAFCNKLSCIDEEWRNSKWFHEELKSYFTEDSDKDSASPAKKKEIIQVQPPQDEEKPETDEKDLRIKELERKLRDAERRANSYRHQIIELEREIKAFEEEATVAKDTKPEYIEEEKLDEPTEPEIEYPFETDRKITIFGGFDSFHREIEKLIPGIRIIEPTARLQNTDPLTNADMVFFQPNKMDHSNYYAARNAVRNAEVPSWHLRWASAKRCADFIVQRIREHS